MRNERLTDVIHQYGGKYLGNPFQYDALQKFGIQLEQSDDSFADDGDPLPIDNDHPLVKYGHGI